jgi:ribosome-binding protein aMBF1 (putative translation factor)
MQKKEGHRIYRTATDEERKRHAVIREQIAAEVPELKKQGRAVLEAIKEQGTSVRKVIAALRAERERQGLSLADLNERTGIDRAALSRLENNEEANPTINTLERYAAAVGKQMFVFLADSGLGNR